MQSEALKSSIFYSCMQIPSINRDFIYLCMLSITASILDMIMLKRDSTI